MLAFLRMGFICLVLVTFIPDLSLFVPKLAGLVK